jgi:CBS domain-containing protein
MPFRRRIHAHEEDEFGLVNMRPPAITTFLPVAIPSNGHNLRDSDIHHLPLVRGDKLVGFITPLDVLEFFLDKVLPPPAEVG